MFGSVSSFAYQGTNSHAVLEATSQFCEKPAQQQAWQRKRLWYQLTSHPLMGKFSYEDMACVQCSLQRPVLCYLFDYNVQGQIVAPAPFLLEMASAAGLLYCQIEWHHGQGHHPALLSNVLIGLPLHLDASASAPTVLSVILKNGAMKLASSKSHLQAHMRTCQSNQSGQPCYTAAEQERSGLLPTFVASDIGSSNPAFGTGCGPRFEDTGYMVHPAVCEACLQLHIAARLHESGDKPASLASLEVYAAICGSTTTTVACTAASNHACINHWLGEGTQLVMLEPELHAHIPLVAGAANQSSAIGYEANCPPQERQPDFQSLHHSILTSLIDIAAMLLNTEVTSDQPLMEAGLDSIGDAQLFLHQPLQASTRTPQGCYCSLTVIPKCFITAHRPCRISKWCTSNIWN